MSVGVQGEAGREVSERSADRLVFTPFCNAIELGTQICVDTIKLHACTVYNTTMKKTILQNIRFFL